MKHSTLVILFWVHFAATLSGSAFSIPQPNAHLEFPRAHGAHLDYGIEWWYLTGHLEGEGDRRFGYQATFFRFAQEDPASNEPSQIYMAHMALTDINNAQFYHQQKLNRDGWNTHAATDTLNLRNANWTLVMTDPERETMQLRATIDSTVEFNLILQPGKPMVRFGPEGLSRKGADPEAVSYYLSFTRLQTYGQLIIDGQVLEVSGESWMDHEIASNQLSEDLAGWDWTAIQLFDGREIKAYRLRRHDGSMDTFSRLIWIDREGATQEYEPGQFDWVEKGYWQSAETGATYPNTVELLTPWPGSSEQLTLRLEPVMEKQEVYGTGGSLAYWEGACEVYNEAGALVGRAYLELAGYAEPLNPAPPP